MYTATTQLSITEFVPMSGVVDASPSIKATISPPINTSPQPIGQDTPVFTGDGQSITVTVLKTYVGSTQLTYQLFDPRYVLLGLAFRNVRGGAGRIEFNCVDIDRDPGSSQIVVTDTCNPALVGIDYSYVILIQEVESGFIGLIDPNITTETEE